MGSHHDWVNQTVKLHNATKPFAPENGRCLRFAVGDKVIYTNPAGLKCRIPDDCIDSKRYPLFMARAVLQELIESLQSIQGVKPC